MINYINQNDKLNYIAKVYQKNPTLNELDNLIDNIINYKPANDNKRNKKDISLECSDSSDTSDDEIDDEENNKIGESCNTESNNFQKSSKKIKKVKAYTKKDATIIDIIKMINAVMILN